MTATFFALRLSGAGLTYLCRDPGPRWFDSTVSIPQLERIVFADDPPSRVEWEILVKTACCTFPTRAEAEAARRGNGDGDSFIVEGYPNESGSCERCEADGEWVPEVRACLCIECATRAFRVALARYKGSAPG